MTFERYTAKQIGIQFPGPHEVASLAIRKKPEWARSTWRQVKASLIYYYSVRGDHEAMIAVAALEREGELECKRRGTGTSARRKKQISEADMAAIISAVRSTESPYAAILETWLRLGAIAGLRPHEWGQSSVVSECAEFSGIEAGGPFLRIQNSKNSNGRAHGDYRHLDLQGCSPDLIFVISEFCGHMSRIQNTKKYKKLYAGCKNLLQIANKAVFGKDEKWIQLYSPRHKFSSEAKLKLSHGEVAAAMGHATDKTASIHYGRRISASGGLMVRPVSGEVDRIKMKKTPPKQSPGASGRPTI